MEDMKPVLLLLDATIDWESSDLEKQIVEISSQMNNDYRITIIDNDGSVLADSETGNPETMENHKNRKEVKEAFQNGFGTKVRNSSTIKGSMMYAAYCSPTQHKVIRISIHHDVITDPVSYTHLDVYKRQALHNIRMTMILSLKRQHVLERQSS